MLRLKTAATVEPVSLAAAKAHASVHPTATDDDETLALMVSAARAKFEDESAYLLSQRTYEWEIDSTFVLTDAVGSYILLPVRPALSVVSITGLTAPDPDAEPDPIVGDWTFDVDLQGVGRIRLNEGIAITDEVVVEFTAGSPDPVENEIHAAPAHAKLAIMALVSHWYMNREAYGARAYPVGGSFESVVRNFRLA